MMILTIIALVVLALLACRRAYDAGKQQCLNDLEARLDEKERRRRGRTTEK